MKKLFTLAAAATFFFSLNGAARAATPDSQMQPQRSGSTFFTDDGEAKGEGKKRDGGKKKKPDPTPRPRRPGPRDEPESNDD